MLQSIECLLYKSTLKDLSVLWFVGFGSSLGISLSNLARGCTSFLHLLLFPDLLECSDGFLLFLFVSLIGVLGSFILVLLCYRFITIIVGIFGVFVIIKVSGDVNGIIDGLLLCS